MTLISRLRDCTDGLGNPCVLAQEAADHIEQISREWNLEIQRSYKQLNRIKALKAALQKIDNIDCSKAEVADCIEIARRALEGKP